MMRYWIASCVVTFLMCTLIIACAYSGAPGATLAFIATLAVLVGIAAGVVLLEPRGKR